MGEQENGRMGEWGLLYKNKWKLRENYLVSKFK
jgi:hypothetical protein